MSLFSLCLYSIRLKGRILHQVLQSQHLRLHKTTNNVCIQQMRVLHDAENLSHCAIVQRLLRWELQEFWCLILF